MLHEMSRPIKKFKRDDAKPILSGNFMISLHEQQDENVNVAYNYFYGVYMPDNGHIE
jgi:hypothetical protein